MGKAAGRVRPGQGKVVVAYLHPDEVSVSFHHSLIGMLLWDLQHEGRILGGGGHIGSFCGTGRLPDGRNDATKKWLDDHDADWLFFVDSDMGFRPDTVEALIRAADPVERPVVGGLCFGQRIVAFDGDMHMPVYDQFPTLYQWGEVDGQQGFKAMRDYPRNSLVRVGATGAACILIHRSAAEKVRAKHGDNWWTPAQVDGDWFSEDMSFCLRLATVDVPLHVHTGVKTTHHKGGYLSEASYAVPAAVDGTVVAIPTKSRWDLLEPLLSDLSGQGAAHIVVIDDGLPVEDRAELDEVDGVTVLESPGGGIHAMWNLALDWAQERGRYHVALLNDDITTDGKVVEVMADAFRVDANLAVASPRYDGRPGHGIVYTDEICANRYDGSGGVAGFAMWLAADFAASYRFPEDCVWWFGDNDAVLSARLAGGNCGIVLGCDVVHVDGGGQSGGWDANDPVLRADEQAFRRKWGG
jgi:GT2 family glycosyltransferase